MHHLAVDGVSWRILLEDLETAYGQLARGEAARLPAKTTSWKAWAERLAEHARSAAMAEESSYWAARSRLAAKPLPVDGAGGEDTIDRARAVSLELDADETEALLREVPAAYRTRIDEVLLCGLAGALRRWTGERRVRVALEGHGREEEVVGGADLSRTVGWFTSLYPVLLELPRQDGAGAALKAVKEQLRAVPGRGIGYGLLRWGAASEAGDEPWAVGEAEVSFNYLGQLDQVVSSGSFFAFAPESAGEQVDGRTPRDHILEVTGAVREGRLGLRIGYAEGMHRRDTVERLAAGYAEELRELIAHCRGADAGGYTPSDFPLAGLEQGALDALVGNDRGVEDVYPLTPMQEGMLFHTLYAPGSGVYVEQSSFMLDGPLDVEALERAWQGAAARHEALRAGFAWEGAHRPLQLVRREVTVPFRRTDWSGLDAAERGTRLAEHLSQDRARGFDLAAAPLMRLTLFRLGVEEHLLLWTYHHLILDGWSLAVIFRDVLALYSAHARGEAPQAAPGHRYRDYVAWLERQDRAGAEGFWREALAGFVAPTRLPAAGAGRKESGPGAPGAAKVVLSDAATQASRELALRHGVTMSTQVQGAWALLLSRYAGEEDVVFGATVSGRPAELRGVEETVGLFINTLPVRVRVDTAATVREWLEAMQEQQVRAREFEYSPLVEVKKWSDVPEGEPLFESLVVFENYPVDLESGEPVAGLQVRMAEGVDQANYPLVLAAHATDALALDLRYDRTRFDAETAERLVGHVEAALVAMASGAGRRLRELSLLSGAERRQVVEAWNATGAEFPRTCAHELFAEQAARTPDAPALLFADQALSYAELQRRANRLAHHLRRRGVGPETTVGMCLDRSAGMVVAILGILRAGGAYLPLDPAYPHERLRHMLADSGAAVVLTRTELAGRVAEGYAGAVVLLDAEREAIAGEPDTPPESGVGPQNAAYVIYTSGSTGVPKGVVVPHLGLCNVARAQARDLGVSPGDRVLQFASASFDASVFETVMALACGGTLCLGTPEELAPGPDLLRFLRERGVTAATLPLGPRRPPGRGAAGAAAADDGGRGAPGRAGGPLGAGPRPLQPVRPHRGDHLVHHGPLPRGGRASADRAPHRQRHVLRPGRCPGAGAGGRPGGTVRGRSRGGAGLPGPAGAHRRPLRPGRALRRARGAPVPHGRPRAVAAGGRAGVPGPHRPAGQGPGLPHRAGRGGGACCGSTGRSARRWC